MSQFWADLVFTGGGFVLALMLLPTILDEDSAVPRLTSVPTAAVIASFAVTFHHLQMDLSATMNLLTALGWAFIAMYRAPE